MKGSHEGQTSYLSWVRNEYALYAPYKLANQANESAKINVEIIKKVTKIGLIHHRLGHLSLGRLTQVWKSVHDIEIQGGDFPKDCDICIHAKKTKLQNYSAMTRASKPLEQIYMDFWGPYQQSGMNGERYILTITDNHTRYGWVFTISGQSSKELIEIIERWIELVEH